MPKVSVLILNYNVSYYLDLCLISVKAAIKNHHVEIIVVDNASPDDSVQMIKDNHPDIKLIENKENSGYPKGNNLGFKAVRGEWLLVLNPDMVVPENLFDDLLSKTTVENQGIVGCYLMDGCGQFLPESKRKTPTPWVATTKMLGLYKIFPNVSWFNQYYAMHIPKTQDGVVDVLVGAFMWMKASLYQKLNGFDENCFMYADDIDLCYRAKAIGYQNMYWSHIKAIHYKGESTSRDMLYIKRFNEGMRYFYSKHFKKSFLFNWMMGITSYLFSLKKALEKPIKPKKTHNYYIFPDNTQLRTKIQQKLQKNIIPLSDINIAIEKNSCIIFDNNQLAFTDILKNMTTLFDKTLTFRIIPKNRQYYIGSDSKNDKGEVFKFY